jgi:hypothetical protein
MDGLGTIEVRYRDSGRVAGLHDIANRRDIPLAQRNPQIAILSVLDIIAELLRNVLPTLHRGARKRKLGRMTPGLAHPSEGPPRGHAGQRSSLHEGDAYATTGKLVRCGGAADPTTDNDHRTGHGRSSMIDREWHRQPA